MNLGRDASNVKTSSTEGTTLLDTSGFETELWSFNGGDVTAGTTTEDNDIIFIRSGSETSCWPKRKSVPNKIFRWKENGTLSTSQVSQTHFCIVLDQFTTQTPLSFSFSDLTQTIIITNSLYFNIYK